MRTLTSKPETAKTKPCERCGEMFTYYRINARYCPYCKRKVEREKHKERMAKKVKASVEKGHKFRKGADYRVRDTTTTVHVCGSVTGWHEDALDFRDSRFYWDDFRRSLKAGCFPRGLVITVGRERYVVGDKRLEAV